MSLALPLIILHLAYQFSEFEIKNCNWSSGKDVIVEASLLESILIQEEYVDIDDLQGQSIKFNALYLKEFSYCGYGISQQIYLLGCGFRSYASVKIILNSCENIATCFAFQLFQHFHQVNCIKLEGSKVLTQSKVVYPVSVSALT